MNVADLLADSAAAAPGRDAIIAPDGKGGWSRITFLELDTLVTGYGRFLQRQGVAQGDLSLVMVPPGIPLIALFYALLRIGAVPVMIDPGMGLRAFLRCVETSRPRHLIGVPKAHVARALFGRSFQHVRTRFVVGASPLGIFGTPLREEAGDAPIRVNLMPEALAAVLFTSGSTGPAKGACYTVRNFYAQRDALRDLYHFEPGEVDLAAFPLFSLFDAAFGMTSVIPDIDPAQPARCEPEKIVEAIHVHKATSAFGSPAIWSRVAPWCAATNTRLDGLTRVLMAGAPVPLRLVTAMRAALPESGEVHTPYGATESLPVATISGREVESLAARVEQGDGTCVGRPIPSIDVRLIAITDGPISAMDDVEEVPQGSVGEICVRGAVVTRSYLHRPDATMASKINDIDRLWHRMGDLGYRDAEGRLWFCGRKAEAVFTKEGPVFTDRIECRFSGIADFPRVALVGVGPKGSARPVLVVEGVETPSVRQEAERISGLPDVLFHRHFPVDRRHNAKIHRLTLATWARSRLS